MAIAKNAATAPKRRVLQENRKKAVCHDCKREIKVLGQEIKNGVLLKYEDEGREIKVFKCSACYQQNPSLTNFRQCEVYSRIVGYLRPVQQWNAGKKGEFQDRQAFRLAKGC